MGRNTPVNAEVVARVGETLERLIKRFLKKVKKAGVFEELRERVYYKKPSLRRREEAKKRKQVLAKLHAEEEKSLNNY